MVEHNFKGIVNTTNSRSRGQFVLGDKGIVWRPGADSSAARVLIDKATVRKLVWTPCGSYAMLHVIASGGEGEEEERYERFDGFRQSDVEVFSEMFKEHYGVPLEKEKLSSSGLNAGTLLVDKERQAMALSYEDRPAIMMPLSSISQCVAPGKNDVEIHFHEDDTGPREDELLIEMKFYVPPNEEGEDVSEALQRKLVTAAGIERATGDVICQFTEDVGTFQAPRGRYEVLMYDKFFRMIGKTYEYKVMYKSISRMFMLERLDQSSYAFVISLDDPIQQGQQRHKHLVWQVDTRDEEVVVNLSKEVLHDKYEDKLPSTVAGRLCDSVARLFKVLTNKKVFVTGSFVSYYDSKAVKCALKTHQGLLYPLGRSLFFIHKPATFIRYEDIEYIEFQRYSGSANQSSRNFDLEVSVRPVGGESEQTFLFAGIEKAEYEPLFNFLSSKKIKIKNLRAAQADARGQDDEGAVSEYARAEESMMMEEESDDEDFQSGDEAHSDDSESDVSLASDDGPAHDGEDDGEGEDEDDGEGDGDGEGEDGGKSKSKKEKKRKRETSAGAGESEAKRKKLPRRDPKAPKPAKRPYDLFQASRREELAAEGLSFGEISTKISTEWKALTAEQKAAFDKQVEEDKERFAKEMEAYEPAEGYGKDGTLLSTGDDAKSAKSPTKKKSRDPGAPKPPKVAYAFFTASRREELAKEGLSFGEINKKVSAEWKALSDEAKAPFEKQHEEDKARYNKEMESYTPAEGYNDKGQLKKAKGEAGQKSKKSKSKPAASAYQFFSTERRAELKETTGDSGDKLSFGEISKQVGQEWKAMAPADKAKYEQMAAEHNSKAKIKEEEDDEDDEEEDGDQSAAKPKKQKKAKPAKVKEEKGGDADKATASKSKVKKERKEPADSESSSGDSDSSGSSGSESSGGSESGSDDEDEDASKNKKKAKTK